MTLEGGVHVKGRIVLLLRIDMCDIGAEADMRRCPASIA
jgi:hypothetical protein